MGKWYSNQKFYGMNSLLRSTELPLGICADSLNSDLGSSSQAGPMKGYQRYGHQANVNNRIVRKFTYHKGDGVEIQLQVRDNSTNYIVEYLNESDTRNSEFGQWSILEAGLSRVITLSSGATQQAKFDFAAFNTTGTNQLIYGNQVETMRIWNGAIGAIAATTATTITLVGSTSAATRGFAASGSLIINGTTYAYTGLSGNQFTGVTGNPTGEAIGSGITQVVNTTTLSSAGVAGILLSAHGRLYLAGMTATPNSVNYSDVGDAADYAGTNPNDGGTETFAQMNGDVTALSSLGEWVIVFSRKKIIAFKLSFPTSSTKVTNRKEIASEGCPSHKAVRKLGDQIVYITTSGGIKRITQITNENVFNVEDLADPLRPTIKNFVWDDGVLEYAEKDKVFLACGQSSTLVTNNDRIVMLWLSSDGLGNRIINLGISDWAVGDATYFKNFLHFGGSMTSRSYRAFDGFSKDGNATIWRRTERTEFFGSPWAKKEVKYLAIRGAIGSGTTLTTTLRYGLNGSISSPQMTLLGTDSPFVIQTPLNVLGGFELGTEPLGGTIDDIEDLNPFIVIYELPTTIARDFQLEFKTDGLNNRIAIDSYGFYVEESDEDEAVAIDLRALN